MSDPTDTERLDWLERDAGRTVYPHGSFGGKEWACEHYAFTSLREAVDVAMSNSERREALAADPTLVHQEYAERRAAWQQAFDAWKARGRVGSSPPHPVAPHTVGRR